MPLTDLRVTRAQDTTLVQASQAGFQQGLAVAVEAENAFAKRVATMEMLTQIQQRNLRNKPETIAAMERVLDIKTPLDSNDLGTLAMSGMLQEMFGYRQGLIQFDLKASQLAKEAEMAQLQREFEERMFGMREQFAKEEFGRRKELGELDITAARERTRAQTTPKASRFPGGYDTQDEYRDAIRQRVIDFLGDEYMEKFNTKEGDAYRPKAKYSQAISRVVSEAEYELMRSGGQYIDDGVIASRMQAAGLAPTPGPEPEEGGRSWIDKLIGRGAAEERRQQQDDALKQMTTQLYDSGMSPDEIKNRVRVAAAENEIPWDDNSKRTVEGVLVELSDGLYTPTVAPAEEAPAEEMTGAERRKAERKARREAEDQELFIEAEKAFPDIYAESPERAAQKLRVQRNWQKVGGAFKGAGEAIAGIPGAIGGAIEGATEEIKRDTLDKHIQEQRRHIRWLRDNKQSEDRIKKAVSRLQELLRMRGGEPNANP